MKQIVCSCMPWVPSLRGRLQKTNNTNYRSVPEDILLLSGNVGHSNTLSENISCGDSPHSNDEPPNEGRDQLLEKSKTNNIIDTPLPDDTLGSFIRINSYSEHNSCGDNPCLKEEITPNEGKLLLPNLVSQLLEKSETNNTIHMPLPDVHSKSLHIFPGKMKHQVVCSRRLWVPSLRRRLRKKSKTNNTNYRSRPHEGSNILLLPEDIIINIFSQLTAEDAFRCLCVCRTLRAILLTPYFVAMNLQRATSPPILVIQCAQLIYEYKNRNRPNLNLHRRDLDLHFIDGCEGIATSMRYLRANNDWKPLLIGSYNGLLLFKNSTVRRDSVFFVWNPITQEQVTVIAPDKRYCICGLFFHSPTNEYRILYACWGVGYYKYIILSLGTKLLRKIANRTEIPCISRPPIILNGALHWMVNADQCEGRYNLESPGCSKSIMLFHVISEEFATMPHPGEECCSSERHKNMQLLEWNGHLSFFNIISSTKAYFWVLQDYVKQVWVKTHTIDIELLIAKHMLRNTTHSLHFWLQAIHIHQEELVILWNHWEIFYFHLKLKTFRRVSRIYIPLDGLASVVVHSNSIASLHSDSLIAFEDC